MELLKCNSCGARVIVDKECKCPCGIVCCDEKMVEVKANSVEAAVEKHVPSYEIQEDNIYVKVDHVMEDDHYIEWIAMESIEGLDIRYLKPGDSSSCIFKYLPGKSTLYAFCNKHGLWKKDVE